MNTKMGLYPVNKTKVVRRALQTAFIAVCLLFGFTLILGNISPAQAATGINEQVNFQARLLNNLGAVVADGSYNMRFKIYQDGDGVLGGGDETLKWTETRESTDKVTVRNGYFSVNLGSVTAFGASVDWNQSVLWLSVDIGGTGSPSYDGEMTPFKRLSSNPYALNAGRLGGIAASGFIQLQGSTPGSAQTGNLNITGTAIAGTFSGSGASLTTLNGSNISSGTVPDARLSANVTLQGNTFNGASQLVQLTAGGLIPALDGSLLTTLNASNLSSGTVSDARLSANVALLNGTGPQIFTGNNKFTGTFLHQNASNSTTAFQIQNAAGNGFFVADTTNQQITLNAGSDSINTNLRLFTGVSAGSTAHSALQFREYAGGAYDYGLDLLYDSDNSVNSLILQNVIGGTTADVLTITRTSGATTFKNSANTTSAFQVQNAGGNNYLQVNTSGATVSLGSPGIASTVQIGNTTGAVAQTVNVGNNATASSTNTVVVGSTIGTSTTTIQGGTGGVNLGTGGIANTIQIGNTTGAVAQTVNIGNNATASSTSTVVIGNLLGTSTTTIQGGTGNINLKSGGNIVLGTSDTTGTLLVLDTKTGSGDPTGVNGGMYYNSNSGKFRCYENSAWANCLPNIDSANGSGGSTSSTSYVSTGAPAVTLNTGTSAIVTLNARHHSATVGCNVYISVAVSGATTIAAADSNGILEYVKVVNYYEVYSRTFKLTGLTAGSNTFTMNYKVGGGCTATFGLMDITVQALP